MAYAAHKLYQSILGVRLNVRIYRGQGIESGATVRQAAKKFGISKSTVHKDMSERLRYIDPNVAEQVREVLQKNKDERHMRGGMATYMKYKEKREKKAALTGMGKNDKVLM